MLARVALPLMLGAAGAACAPEVTAPPKTPTATTTTAPDQAQAGSGKPSEEPSDANRVSPFVVKRTLKQERIPAIEDAVLPAGAAKLPPAPKGLPAAPASCNAYVSRKASKPPACAESASGLAALDAALASPEAAKRDEMLAGLEACAGLPVGVVRTIRVELAPPECADAIAEPVLKAPPLNIKKAAYYALLGQTLAARLTRTAAKAPELKPPFERKRVEEFVKGPMIAWMNEQARVIQEIATMAADLPFYAKGVVAVEAGMADMRVVEQFRAAPVPQDIAKDEELRNVYYAALDQELEPRKTRGRDAALVGLRNLAAVGVIKDARIDKARALLSKLYGGRRVDALDALLLPEIPPPAPSTMEERLAAKLPTFSAGLLLEPSAAMRPGTLRALLQKGIPAPMREAFKDVSADADARALYARAHMELGRLYWRATDFDRIVQLLSTPGGETPSSEDQSLLLATAIALGDGPDDAAEMMRKAPLQDIGVGQVAALDSIAKGSGKLAGVAAFDAALVLQIAAPQSAKAAYWKDVAERFRKAASKLPAGPSRAAAEERARSAEAVAAAIPG